MRRPGVPVLSASSDPGWTATVNGRPEPARMVAPALVAVDVPAGTDHVVFRCHGYGDCLGLLALSGLTLVMLAVAPVCLRRASRRRGARESACRRRSASTSTWKRLASLRWVSQRQLNPRTEPRPASARV